jgi:hypothetical protein
VHGAWCTVRGAWCVVRGARFVCGAWCVPSLYTMVCSPPALALTLQSLRFLPFPGWPAGCLHTLLRI